MIWNSGLQETLKPAINRNVGDLAREYPVRLHSLSLAGRLRNYCGGLASHGDRRAAGCMIFFVIFSASTTALSSGVIRIG